MENTSYYLSEYGNIWTVEHDTQYVYCNGSCVTSHFEVASYPGCKVGECLYAEDHYMNTSTTSKEILAINENVISEKIHNIIDSLEKLRELYGPLELVNNNGKFDIIVFVGDSKLSQLKLGTLDFDKAEISLIEDLSIEGIKLEAQENWKTVKDIVDIFEESMEFDCEVTLDGNNPDLKDSRIASAYYRLTEKLAEKLKNLAKDKDELNIDEDKNI